MNPKNLAITFVVIVAAIVTAFFLISLMQPRSVAVKPSQQDRQELPQELPKQAAKTPIKAADY